MSNGPNNAGKGTAGSPFFQVARYGTEYLNVPPNKHRLYNALGLMAGLYVGRKIMNILVGETPEGKPIHEEDLIAPIKPLRGVLAYDHFSDNPKDRWMKVFDLMVPGVIGGMGAVGGSYMFFREPILKISKATSKVPLGKFGLEHAEQVSLLGQYDTLSKVAGAAALPGSAAGLGFIPSTANYSTALGMAFTAGAERTMAAPGLRSFFNSHSSFPWRWHMLIGKMTQYLAHNPSASPARIDEYMHGIIKPLFNGVTEKQLGDLTQKVLARRNAFVNEGKVIAGSEAKIAESVKGLFADMGFEKMLIDVGLDPREAAVGDAGIVTTLSRWIGDGLGLETSKKMEAARKAMFESLEHRFPELKGKAFNAEAHTHAQTDTVKAAAAGLLGVSAASVGAVALAKDVGMADLSPPKTRDKSADKTSNAANAARNPNHHHVHSKHRHNFVDGKLLDMSEGVSGMLSAGIGAHRVHCAVGLTVGSWLGDKYMDALTGIKFSGTKVSKEEVWKPLQGIYKKMAFNPHSDHMHDRWMQVLRWGVPGILGAFGAVQGSRLFFEERSQDIKKSDYLDEAEAKATFQQARPWTYTAAISSLFGFPSGMSMLSFTNYATHLGTRFSMASGRKVSMPVIGKIWSNNSTLFPYAPPGMIDMMIKEAVNNKGFDPELLETYAVGALKPWFENVTPQQVEAFVLEVHKIRDKFFKEGGVPEQFKATLEKELKEHLKGAGLEHTLEEIGLDPLKATLANNGLSGSIADALGAKSEVDKTRKSYAEKFKHRHEAEVKPAESYTEIAERSTPQNEVLR
ncbi:MAG: hypothetical protein ACK502_08730 [Alphaproteobacteria bacterium]